MFVDRNADHQCPLHCVTHPSPSLISMIKLRQWRRTLCSRLNCYEAEHINHLAVVIAPNVPSCLVDVVTYKLEQVTIIDPLLEWGPTDLCDQPEYRSVTERYIQVI